MTRRSLPSGWLWILLAGSAFADVVASQRGDERVAFGNPVALATAPWSVSLERAGRHHCGGALIGSESGESRWLLTAAHCLSLPHQARLSPAELRVAYGSNRLDRARKTGVARIVIHPEWLATLREIEASTPNLAEANRKALMRGHDVALIELSSTLTAAGEWQIADGRRGRQLELPGVMATVSGWGDVEGGSASSGGLLRAASLPIVDQSTCSSLLIDHGGNVSERQLCAGLGENRADACRGDSGAALSVADTQGGLHLIGIVSFGAGCGNPGSFGVYTRIGAFATWISSVVAQRGG